MVIDNITKSSVFILSEDVIVRDIEGEIIIVPLTSDIGDMEDVIYTLNKTGRAILEKLDSQKSLLEVIKELQTEFEATSEEIEVDTLGLIVELYKRHIIVEV
jgi:hypothetical protein